MLSDWEERQLADIERELSADRELGRVLAAPTRHERLWLAFERRFYPVGYLLCALGYMTVAAGSSQLPTLVAAYLIVAVLWLAIEFRVTGYQELVLNGLRGLGGI